MTADQPVTDPAAPPAAEAPAAIEVRGLWSVFPRPGGGEVVVHKDLDLTVRRGEVLAFDTPEAVRANARVQEAYLGSSVADAQVGGP